MRRRKNEHVISIVSACFAQRTCQLACLFCKRVGKLLRIRTVRSLANRLRAKWMAAFVSFSLFFSIYCVKLARIDSRNECKRATRFTVSTGLLSLSLLVILLKIVLASQVGCRSIGKKNKLELPAMCSHRRCWLSSAHLFICFYSIINLWSLTSSTRLNWKLFKFQRTKMKYWQTLMNWKLKHRQTDDSGRTTISVRPALTRWWWFMRSHCPFVVIDVRQSPGSVCGVFLAHSNTIFFYVRVAIVWMRFHREIEMWDGRWRLEMQTRLIEYLAIDGGVTW